MINPDFEVDRLIRNLVFKGLTEAEAAEIGNFAMQDIQQTVEGLVSDAVQTAAEVGMTMGADEFVEQITVARSGGIFKITTISGKTDFSLPPFPMLPRLLKNAKTAKDGSKYKIIPIGGKSIGSKNRRLTLFDVQTDINKQQTVDREQRKLELDQAKKTMFSGSPTQFSGLQKAQQFLSRKMKEQKAADRKVKINAKVEYRTATSKQDPSSQWVLPSKDLNMTMILDDINRQLESNAQKAIVDIVKRYEELA